VNKRTKRRTEGRHVSSFNEDNARYLHASIEKQNQQYPELREPGRNFNGDEFGMLVNPKDQQKAEVVFVRESSKLRAKSIAAGNAHITVTLMTSACGRHWTRMYTITRPNGAPPITFLSPGVGDRYPREFSPGMVSPEHWFSEENGFFLNASQSGFTTHEFFTRFLKETVQFARKEYPRGALRFIIDGPRVHEWNADMGKLLLELSTPEAPLVIAYLQHNTTHLTQPADLLINAFVKTLAAKIMTNFLIVSSPSSEWQIGDELTGDLVPCQSRHMSVEARSYGMIGQDGKVRDGLFVWVCEAVITKLTGAVVREAWKRSGIVPLSLPVLMGKVAIGVPDHEIRCSRRAQERELLSRWLEILSSNRCASDKISDVTALMLESNIETPCSFVLQRIIADQAHIEANKKEEAAMKEKREEKRKLLGGRRTNRELSGGRWYDPPKTLQLFQEAYNLEIKELREAVEKKKFRHRNNPAKLSQLNEELEHGEKDYADRSTYLQQMQAKFAKPLLFQSHSYP